MILAFQGIDGLVFWPAWEIASWSPEFRGRWRVVHCSGEVAHSPTPPPPGPWVRLGEHQVLPRWLSATPEGWRNPAGFLLEAGVLPEVEGPPESPVVEGLPCRLDQVKSVSLAESGKSIWDTELGAFELGEFQKKQLTALYPELVLLAPERYYHSGRLRRVESADRKYHRFVFRDGEQVLIRRNPNLAGRLGLSSLSTLEPYCAGLYASGNVRDWPFEIATADAGTLRTHFQSLRQLIANLIWQAFRRNLSYGKTHREFWYVPVVTTLTRAGFLNSLQLRWRVEDEQNPAFDTSRQAYMTYLTMLGDFVKPWRFFTLRQFGFRESRPDFRSIGARRPQVLVVAEKESLRPVLERLGRELGVSTLLLSGQPSLLGSEYLADDLRGFGPILVLALVDLDPYGWVIGQAVVDHLRHFGLTVGEVQYVVRGEHLSEEELELFTLPCLDFTPQDRTMAKHWLAQGGGITGRPETFCVNLFRPYSRIRARVESLLGIKSAEAVGALPG